MTRHRFARVLAICFCCVALSACDRAPDPEPSPSDPRAARSQALLDQEVSGTDLPGCSVAVGEQGEVIWTGARGRAVMEPSTPITPETLFDIGSVTKQFTAAAVLLLARDGKLALTDPVARYVSGLPAWSRKVTVDHLIHHTSGIPDVFEGLYSTGVKLSDPVSRERVLKEIARLDRPELSPGTTFDYSSSNYILLAEIVADVSGEPFAAHLDRAVVTPMGLGLVVDPTGAVPERAHSYESAADSTGLVIADSAWYGLGAADLLATPSDLVRWADTYRTGRLGGPDVLDAQLGDAVPVEDGIRYGAGILIYADDRLGHPGSSGRFTSMLTISTDRNRAIAIVCNRADLEAGLILPGFEEIWYST